MCKEVMFANVTHTTKQQDCTWHDIIKQLSLPNPVLLYTTSPFCINGLFHYKNETDITIEAKWQCLMTNTQFLQREGVGPDKRGGNKEP